MNTGCDQLRETCSLPAVAVRFTVLVKALAPTMLTAATRKSYDAPLVSPVTVAPVDAEVPSENVVQVASLLNL